jgi:hypothetical protein
MRIYYYIIIKSRLSFNGVSHILSFWPHIALGLSTILWLSDIQMFGKNDEISYKHTGLVYEHYSIIYHTVCCRLLFADSECQFCCHIHNLNLLRVFMSEFRQHYVRNYTFPSHPLATSILTSQTQAIISEGDGDELVVTRGRVFFLQFCSLPFVIIG